MCNAEPSLGSEVRRDSQSVASVKNVNDGPKSGFRVVSNTASEFPKAKFRGPSFVDELMTYAHSVICSEHKQKGRTITVRGDNSARARSWRMKVVIVACPESTGQRARH